MTAIPTTSDPSSADERDRGSVLPLVLVFSVALALVVGALPTYPTATLKVRMFSLNCGAANTSSPVIRSSAVRAKPIILTALAAMLGALFILDDPIFNGLAVSLIFGILISTVLTLVLIPILYFSYRNRRQRT